MDPSALICFSYDSLKEASPLPSSYALPSSYDSWYLSTPMTLTPHYNVDTSYNGMLYCDTAQYQELQMAKDVFGEQEDQNKFETARSLINPFEKIGRSIFINRAGVKLANIDAVHHITNHIFTFDQQHTNQPFTFCDLAGGPGAFTQYLQYRYPASKGYGITIRAKGLNWNTNVINTETFSIFEGPDNTGNLYTNYGPFIDFVRSQQPYGVDLIVADGAIDAEQNQEFLNSRVIATEATIAIACTKVGGNFVLKVFDTVTAISAQLIFILSQCFEKVLLFKPVSSRPANSERYLICMNRHQNVQSYLEILINALPLYDNDNYVTSFFSNTLPSTFTNWLVQSNDEYLEHQTTSVRHLLQYLTYGTIPEKLPKYNLSKFLTIWNLPDNPHNNQYSKIKIY
jgi:cap1 methyltransferase